MKRNLVIFLWAPPQKKRVKIKALNAVIGTGGVSFGSPNQFELNLGIEPESSSIPAINRNPDNAVAVIYDESLCQEEAFQVHSLANTST